MCSAKRHVRFTLEADMLRAASLKPAGYRVQQVYRFVVVVSGSGERHGFASICASKVTARRRSPSVRSDLPASFSINVRSNGSVLTSSEAASTSASVRIAPGFDRLQSLSLLRFRVVCFVGRPFFLLICLEHMLRRCFRRRRRDLRRFPASIYRPSVGPGANHRPQPVGLRANLWVGAGANHLVASSGDHLRYRRCCGWTLPAGLLCINVSKSFEARQNAAHISFAPPKQLGQFG